jgi:hypothetical protein
VTPTTPAHCQYPTVEYDTGDFVIIANKKDDISKPFLRWSHLSAVVAIHSIHHVEVMTS